MGWDGFIYGVAIVVIPEQHGWDQNSWRAYITLGSDVIFLRVIILHLVDGAAGQDVARG